MTKTNSIEALFEGCKAGNRQSQEKLYQLVSSTMFGLCQRYANDRAEAEDILQTGFVKVFKNIHSFKQTGPFEAWVRRIMVNTAIESYRRRKRMFQLTDLDEELEESIPAPTENQLEYEDLISLIRKLPEGYRMVFNMYAIEGYSHREIAETMRITESTSKSQLLRARDWLKKRITNIDNEVYESRQG